MKAYKFKKWDRIEIFWEDSYQTYGWVRLNESGHEEDISLGHQSIGYFISETKNKIAICQSKKSSKELDIYEDTNVNALFCIPKTCIKKIRRIK